MLKKLLTKIRFTRRRDREDFAQTQPNAKTPASHPQSLDEEARLAELGALAASITHDLRQPLAIIDAEIEQIRQIYQHYFWDGKPLKKHIERIEDQTRAIYAVTQYVNVVRGTKDYYEPFMQKLRIEDLIHRTLKSFKREPTAAQIFFKYEQHRSAYIRGYPEMLEQAISNVLRNAVEAIHESQRAQGTVNLDVRFDQATDTLKLEIRDNGCGIDEVSIPRLTTLYTTKAARKANSGLGLFITQRILTLHSGRLEIESQLGSGTTVSLCFPKLKD